MNPCIIRPLDEHLRKIARDELNEVEERIPEDIAQLRSWIEVQPHLRARTDNQFLVAFLRGCKYSLEKAKSKIDYFYTMQTMMPEMLGNKVMNEKNIDLCRTGAAVHLSNHLNTDGSRMHFTIFSKLDAKKFTMLDLLRYDMMMMNMEIYEDNNATICGYTEIMDFAKINLSLVVQMHPILVKKLVSYTEKAIPLRLKGVHCVNCPREAIPVLNLIKSTLNAKLQKRFHFYKNLDDFHKSIPKEILPSEFGGTKGSLADVQAESEKRLMAFNDYFIEDDKYGVNEKLRPNISTVDVSLYGVEGTFRKMNID